MRGPTAYTMSTKSLSGKAGVKRIRSSNRTLGQPASLAPENVEVLRRQGVKPPQAGDSALAGYPPEYRKLIKDYFMAVTKEKK